MKMARLMKVRLQKENIFEDLWCFKQRGKCKGSYFTAFDEFVLSFKLSTMLPVAKNGMVLFGIDEYWFILLNVMRQWHS